MRPPRPRALIAVLASALVAAASAAGGGCVAGDDDWPVRPPGGGGAGGGDGSGGDAGMDSGDGLRGRLCVIDDLRFPDRCPAGDADDDGVRIRVVGGATTMTAEDGTFTLPVPDGPQLVELDDASGALVAATARVVPGGGLALRAARAAPFADLLAAIGVSDIDGLGTIVVYVDDADGDALAGVLFEPVAGAAFQPFHDDGAATRWRTDTGTGAAGVALIVGVPPGVATVNATAPGARTLTLTGVPVRSDAITFVRTTVP